MRKSNQNALHLVQAHVVAPPVVELGCPRGGVVRHGGGLFERAAVLEIGRDARRPKRVIADFRPDIGRCRAAADHGVGIGLGKRRRRQRIRAAADRPKQRPLRIAGEAAAVDIGVKVGLKIVVAGHFMALAALLVQANPQPAVLHVNVLDLHRERRADAGEGIDHEADQGAVAQGLPASSCRCCRATRAPPKDQARASCRASRCATARARKRPDSPG